jgi:hypothetical protein
VPKFPEPDSAHLARIGPTITRLPAGTRLWRIYLRGGNHPSHWSDFRVYGPAPAARFDHHLPPPREQERAIYYAATLVGTCLAEVFQKERVIDRWSEQPWLVSFRLDADLELLDLSDTWPTAAGASMALCSGQRDRAQRWSRAIYDAYPAVHGLWYPSSMFGNRPSVALYERARSAFPPAPVFHRSLADPLLLRLIRRVATQIDYRLV